MSRSAASHRSELRVTNAWPSVIEARRNRNALRRRKEHTRGDTDSRPARRQGPLVHGLSGPVTTNSGKGSPSTAWDIKAGCTRSARQKNSSQAPAQGRYLGHGGSQSPPTGAHTPHNRQPQRRAPLRRRPPLPAVRPAVRGGYGRSGRLHAPEAARTGPLSAFRPYFSWTPQGQWFNGQNGHFSCQPGRNRDGTPPGPYGSGFNGPRDFSRASASWRRLKLWAFFVA